MNRTFDRYHSLLVEEQKKRPKNSDIVRDEADDTTNFQWVLNERRVMLDTVNSDRREKGLAPIDEKTLVKRAERLACGHTDYTSKFALYSSQLASGIEPPAY